MKSEAARPGRTCLYGNERLQTLSITVTREQRLKAEALGFGSPAAGIRYLLDLIEIPPYHLTTKQIRHPHYRDPKRLADTGKAVERIHALTKDPAQLAWWLNYVDWVYDTPAAWAALLQAVERLEFVGDPDRRAKHGLQPVQDPMSYIRSFVRAAMSA